MSFGEYLVVNTTTVSDPDECPEMAAQVAASLPARGEAGGYAPPGRYTVRIEAIQNDRTVDLQTQLYATVESVNMNSRDGLTLNLEGLGPIAFNNVQQIY